MNTYNSNELKSTLVYIEKKFGREVFTNHGRLISIFSDLAPKLKKERNMIERMSRIGIIRDFALYTGNSEIDQKRILLKAMDVLTQSEYVRTDIAMLYLDVLAEVFDWPIRVNISKENSVPSARTTVVKKSDAGVFVLKESTEIITDDTIFSLIPYSKLKIPNSFHNMYLYVNEEGITTTMLSVYVDVNEHIIYIPAEKYLKYKGVITHDSVLLQGAKDNRKIKVKVSKEAITDITEKKTGKNDSSVSTKEIMAKEIKTEPIQNDNSNSTLSKGVVSLLDDEPYTIIPYDTLDNVVSKSTLQNMYLYVNEEGTATILLSVYVNVSSHRIYVPREKFIKYRSMITKDSVVLKELKGNQSKRVKTEEKKRNKGLKSFFSHLLKNSI